MPAMPERTLWITVFGAVYALRLAELAKTQSWPFASQTAMEEARREAARAVALYTVEFPA